MITLYNRSLSLPQVRTFTIVAVIVFLVVVLLHSFGANQERIEHTRQSIQALTKNIPHSWRHGGSRVLKATSTFGKSNDLYDRAIRSHEEHNRDHGYDMKVLRGNIVNPYWSKPTYLFSLIVEELAKPEETRAQWIMLVSLPSAANFDPPAAIVFTNVCQGGLDQI
jgi:type VI protein secretion system component VasK